MAARGRQYWSDSKPGRKQTTEGRRDRRRHRRTVNGIQERRTKRKTAMRKLDGKIALITGGNSGIDLATAKEVVKEEEYVLVNDTGGSVKGVQGDVSISNLRDLDRLCAQVATAVACLASEDGSHITGSELFVDGGIAQV